MTSQIIPYCNGPENWLHPDEQDTAFLIVFHRRNMLKNGRRLFDSTTGLCLKNLLLYDLMLAGINI